MNLAEGICSNVGTMKTKDMSCFPPWVWKNEFLYFYSKLNFYAGRKCDKQKYSWVPNNFFSFLLQGSFFLPMLVMVYVYLRISCVVANRHDDMVQINVQQVITVQPHAWFMENSEFFIGCSTAKFWFTLLLRNRGQINIHLRSGFVNLLFLVGMH